MDSWVFAEENFQLINSLIEKNQQVSENVIKSELHTLFCNNLNLEGNINDTINETRIIINISSDEEESVELTMQENVDIETNIEVSDDLKMLLDNFQNTGWSLSNDEFLQIMNSEKLENVFKFLETHLSSEGLHNFCLYLTSFKNTKEIENIIKVFCIELLYPKFISSPINTSLEIGVIEVFKMYENILCVNLIDRLIVQENPNLRIVIVLCDKLSFNNKITILSKLLSSCEKLDEDRIELFQTLYVSDVDNNLKQRMINLLYDTADTYSMSKLYGKLMITVLKSLGSSGFSEMENSLNYIVQENKSIYKRAAEKMLQNMF